MGCSTKNLEKITATRKTKLVELSDYLAEKRKLYGHRIRRSSISFTVSIHTHISLDISCHGIH